MGAECGMSESEFWQTTIRFLKARHDAHIRQVRTGWEWARYTAFYASRMAYPKWRRLTDLEKFPWENVVPRFKKQSREELEKFDREADEVLRITQPEVYKKYMEAKQAAANAR